ncbi:MAG: nicotinate-nucleotide adenylyltransferase [Bacteroidia bacterium]|nr:nicotinate-nucleotide adenylyltransferase [Bacteroidia bacterium]
MNIGLFFGSYNPVHVGHMAIAGYMAEFTDLDEVWMVVTPQNPHKASSSLLADYHRLRLVREAIGDYYQKVKASNIEFDLPKPSYTVNTLIHLSEKYPQHQFTLIMGSDNLETFQKWKNYEVILEHYRIMVYPRPGHDGGELKDHPKVIKTNAPLMEISASFIRKAIKNKKDIRYMVPESVFKYIEEMHFYEK